MSEKRLPVISKYIQIWSTYFRNLPKILWAINVFETEIGNLGGVSKGNANGLNCYRFDGCKIKNLLNI